MNFSQFIAKQGKIFQDICLKEGTQVCSTCSSSGLINFAPANWSFRRQIPCANYRIIIIYFKVFFVFFSESIFQKICIFLRSGVRKSGGI